MPFAAPLPCEGLISRTSKYRESKPGLISATTSVLPRACAKTSLALPPLSFCRPPYYTSGNAIDPPPTPATMRFRGVLLSFLQQDPLFCKVSRRAALASIADDTRFLFGKRRTFCHLLPRLRIFLRKSINYFGHFFRTYLSFYCYAEWVNLGACAKKIGVSRRDDQCS